MISDGGQQHFMQLMVDWTVPAIAMRITRRSNASRASKLSICNIVGNFAIEDVGKNLRESALSMSLKYEIFFHSKNTFGEGVGLDRKRTCAPERLLFL